MGVMDFQRALSRRFNIFDFLPSEEELQIAKATRDAQAMEEMRADTNPIRRAPFMAATAMGINPTLASGIPTAIDFAPVTGEISAAVDAKQAYDRGDLATAGLLAGAVALPFVPVSAYRAVGKTAKGLLDRVDVSVDPATVGSMGGNVKVDLKPKGLLAPQVDPTETGFIFKGIGKPNLTKAQNRFFNNGFGQKETILPIRSMNASQDKVNPDFTITESSSGELPLIIKKDNELFVSDGHHRLTKLAVEGKQNARVRLVDFDEPTTTPLLDYDPTAKAKNEALDDDLLKQLGIYVNTKGLLAPQKGEIIEKQSIDNFNSKDPLIVHHNLTEENLISIDRLGGLPSPSIAISKVDQPLLDFGDISLISDAKMAKPSASNDVFRADGYTTRRPNSELTMNKRSISYIEGLGISNNSSEAELIAEAVFQGTEGTYANHALRRAYLRSIGENIDDYTSKKAYSSDGYISPTKFDNVREGYSDFISNLRKDMLANGGEGKERILISITDNGRRYAPATLENFVKVMKKNRGAGAENIHETMGSIRAKLSPRFKNISEIKAERDKIVSSEQFSKIKDAVESDYMFLMETLRKKLPQNIDFRTAEELFNDVLLKKLGTHPYSKPYEQYIDREVFDLADRVRNDLKNMPTEYFEIKPQRGVQLNEFEGAIVPKEVTETTLEILKRNGVENIYKYKNEEERKKLFQKFGHLVFTSTAGAGVATSLSQNNNNQKPQGLLY